MPPDPALSPSPSLLANLRSGLERHMPFAQMATQDVEAFVAASEQRYYAPGEALVEPSTGPVREVFCVREGAVCAESGPADAAGDAIEYEPGDLFPVGAALGGQAVSATYRAVRDTFVLAVPVEAMQALAARSPPLADFLRHRVASLLALSRRAVQEAYASQALAEQSLETPLAQLARNAPVTCRAETPLSDALAMMQQRRVGSILVTDAQGRLEGILTRHDVLGRITLAGVPLAAPIAGVMVQPVHALDAQRTALDAALLMSRHGIRHVPVVREGIVVGLVSERDLFALQRLSIKQVGMAVRQAETPEQLRQAAHGIRRFARTLLGQGVQARQLTGLISHLNDVLTERIVRLEAPRHGVDLTRACWVAFGSEGRAEQTVATDQDNGLVLADDCTAAERERALGFGRAVNRLLDACGYPLCRGGVMAGEPECCLTLSGWRDRFTQWMAQGAPEHLLAASIFFDLRPLAGNERLAEVLRRDVVAAAAALPRFHKQLALNALALEPPLDWLGGIATDAAGTIDLKLQGTALFVDAARVYALAHGFAATNTRERLEGFGRAAGVPATEYEAWCTGLEFLQMLRLRLQLEGPSSVAFPNRLAVATLNDVDRRILKEALRMAGALRQRLKLDYDR
jgi:CBS domain-containing protein